MKDIDLLAIVLDLRPQTERSVKAANWYGRAAQALVYECVGHYDPVYGDQLHQTDEECKPFTTTTLIGSFPKGRIIPQKLYSLRISGLSKRIEEIFLQAVQPGGYFGIGSVIELDKIPFIIEGVYWDNHDHRLACHTNYAVLYDAFMKNKALSYSHIRFDFQKCPVLIQHGAVYDPLITPQIIYRSLQRKWQNHSPIPLKDFSADFMNDGLFVSAYKMESQPVQQEGLVMGGRGTIDISTKHSREKTWATLQMLAAFAFYSGIGKNTTRGFGQTTVKLW